MQLNRLSYRLLCLMLPVSLCATTSLAKPNSGAESPGTPLPKGYDESFQTGDIPKPTTPDLDPENVTEDELAPDKAPDLNPLNDPDLDQEPRDVRVGLSAALTIPHMLNFAIESLIRDKASVSLNYGSVTRSLSNIDVSLKHYDIRLRWFPFATSFFVGAALGQHQLIGELDRNIKEVTTNQTVSARGKLFASANYVAPHVGWFKVWDSGILVGFDLGYLFPTGPKTKFSSTFKNPPAGTESTLKETSEYKKLRSDLEDAAKTHASKPTPFSSLLRLGWMF